MAHICLRTVGVQTKKSGRPKSKATHGEAHEHGTRTRTPAHVDSIVGRAVPAHAWRPTHSLTYGSPCVSFAAQRRNAYIFTDCRRNRKN